MKPPFINSAIICLSVLATGLGAYAQTNSAAETEGGKEAVYTTLIEDRTDAIVNALNVTNAAVSKNVRDLLIGQYRLMRARDILINAQLKAAGKEASYENRAPALLAESKILHDSLFAQLATLLSPEQVEAIKDKMTYNKVKVTSDAYVAIVPDLTAAEKAKILELLKAAREEAVDGGSAPEKSDIFQKYKNQINAYLDAQGHDTAKAFAEWTAKNPNTNSPAIK